VIAGAGEHPKVVLEATYGWYWAADTLAEAGAEVHLAHPLGVKAFAYRRVKNDEKDATDLADLLRMGRLPEAWAAPCEIRELRELTRYRQKLVRARTSVKDQVHAVLAKLGIPVTCSDIFGVWGSTWLDDLPLGQPYAGKVASLRKLAGEFTAEIALLDAVIADLLGRHDGYRDPGPAWYRPGPGGGHSRRDRRYPPVLQRGEAVLLGRADSPPPRV
jgi:transposase